MPALTCLRVRVQLGQGSASDELVCEAGKQGAAVVGELERVSYEQDMNLKLLNNEFAITCTYLMPKRSNETLPSPRTSLRTNF
jgi:hypothetical protein